MRVVTSLVFTALLSASAFCSDLVITQSKHKDAMNIGGKDQPATDSTETIWIGKDRMRSEDGNKVTIVRADQKKLYMLDLKAKTVSTIEMPFDLKKHMPAEMAPMMEQMMAQMKVTVTPTTETKKIKDWNATKYTMTVTMPMGGGITQDLWATKDIKFDSAAFNELFGAMMSTAMGGSAMATELKKIDGFVVLTERVQKMMGQSIKSRDEVTKVDTKDAPDGLYDVPKDFTEKPFDPMADSPMGGHPHPTK